jgi:hypothetical protein
MQGKAYANSNIKKSVEAPTIENVRRAECSPGGGVKVYLEENFVTMVQIIFRVYAAVQMTDS